MTCNTARHARLLRLRLIEHRMAAARLVQADAALSQLKQVTLRIGSLKQGLCLVPGNTTGLSMKSNSEMAQRLDLATASMTAPIEEAQEHLMISNTQRIKAQQREESAVKLYDRAVMIQEQANTLRTDANRPYRKPALMLSESA
jgi:hypothetical protein